MRLTLVLATIASLFIPGALAQEPEPERASAAQPEKAAADEAVCDMPKPSPEAEIILFGARGAEGLSSAAIGSQDDTVEAAVLFVEPGPTPLYVVLTSHSAIIWQVTGAVGRVEHLVLGSNTTAQNEDRTKRIALVGATGLPPERVGFLRSARRCFKSFTEVPSTDASKVVALIRDKLGEEPDVLAASYSVRNLAVPSATIQNKAKQAGDWPRISIPGKGVLRIQGEGEGTDLIIRTLPHDASRQLSISHPARVVDIDPRDVVAPLPVQAYSVLPQQAGIRQLLKDGTLTMNQVGEYLIHKKMRFPAGLSGGHAQTFLLMRGVPLPEGDPGHSTVVSEGTGEVLAEPGIVEWKGPTAGSHR